MVYRVGKSTTSEYELWSVPGTGSSSSAGRISRTLTDGAVERYFQISPNGTRVLYSGDSTPTRLSICTAWRSPAAPRSSSTARWAAPDGVEPDFLISPDSTTAVYRSDEGTDGVIELYSVPMTGGGPTKLNGALPSAGGDVVEHGDQPGRRARRLSSPISSSTA